MPLDVGKFVSYIREKVPVVDEELNNMIDDPDRYDTGIDTVTCPQCGSEFLKKDKRTTCPSCHADLKAKKKVAKKEEPAAGNKNRNRNSAEESTLGSDGE